MSGLVQKLKEMWSLPEDEFDYEYDRENYENIPQARERREQRVRVDSQNNKVVNIHATAQLQVVLFNPERFGEHTRNISDVQNKMHKLVLNL